MNKEIRKMKIQILGIRFVFILIALVAVIFVSKKIYEMRTFDNKVYYNGILVHEYKSPFNRDLPTKQKFFKKPILKSEDKISMTRKYELEPADDIKVYITNEPVKSITEIKEYSPGRTLIQYETYENETIIGSHEIIDSKEALKLKVGPIETREVLEFHDKDEVYKLAVESERGFRNKPKLFAS